MRTLTYPTFFIIIAYEGGYFYIQRSIHSLVTPFLKKIVLENCSGTDLKGHPLTPIPKTLIFVSISKLFRQFSRAVSSPLPWKAMLHVCTKSYLHYHMLSSCIYSQVSFFFWQITFEVLGNKNTTVTFSSPTYNLTKCTFYREFSTNIEETKPCFIIDIIQPTKAY